MNNEERELDLALAEAEQENRLLRARNERLERELADEREACAQVCIGIATKPSNVVLGVAIECAAAIRARGNT